MAAEILKDAQILETETLLERVGALLDPLFKLASKLKMGGERKKGNLLCFRLLYFP